MTEKKISNESTKPSEHTYKMKGIPIHGYLEETGEFRWIPACEACLDKEEAKKMIEVLKKIPEDRRAVWISRIDPEKTKEACRVVSEDANICKEFDDLCAAYSKPETRSDQRNATEVKRP